MESKKGKASKLKCQSPAPRKVPAAKTGQKNKASTASPKKKKNNKIKEKSNAGVSNDKFRQTTEKNRKDALNLIKNQNNNPVPTYLYLQAISLKEIPSLKANIREKEKRIHEIITYFEKYNISQTVMLMMALKNSTVNK